MSSSSMFEWLGLRSIQTSTSSSSVSEATRAGRREYSHNGLAEIATSVSSMAASESSSNDRRREQEHVNRSRSGQCGINMNVTWPEDHHGKAAKTQFRQLREKKLLADGCVMLARTAEGDGSTTPQVRTATYY